MNARDIESLVQAQLGKAAGYDASVAQQFSSHLASVIAAVPAKGGGTPQCYKQCQDTRDAAMAACALKPWPVNLFCVGQAVLAFNACRHACDTAGGGGK